MITTFPVCPFCGDPWVGGATRPGEPMKEGARVFYKCGGQVSFSEQQSMPHRIDGCTILITGCDLMMPMMGY